MSDYVDDFLMDRTQEAQAFDGATVVQVVVNAYREAMDEGKNAAATAYGKLMLNIAEQSKGHPDYRPDWTP
ncbi:hypothetical protein ACMATS_25840 [Streptoverticillium reticulum]|uniref:hypothetical protein n=1 Tax=Streptoverticillium reticulum TaxID=1433415 RepID=UPI0039BEDF59